MKNITIANQEVKAMSNKEYQAQAKRQSNKRATAQAEFEAHMQENVEREFAKALQARTQNSSESAPQLTFANAVQLALDEMRTRANVLQPDKLVKTIAWSFECYPNSTSWCKIQLFGKTKFTCQANQKAVVLISQKRVTDEILNKYAHKVGKQNQFDFRPETPEELKALLIDLMTCNC